MRASKATYDEAAKGRATGRNQKRLRDFSLLAAAVSNDTARAKRSEVGRCKVCWYLASRIGGAVMTEAACAKCGKVVTYGSTATDLLCRECADVSGACVTCGGARGC